MKVSKVISVLIICLPLFHTGYSQPPQKVAVLETVDKVGNIDYGIRLMVRGYLVEAISNTEGYEGYDRVDIGAILGEHDFQRTGMVSDTQIKKLGQMTGAAFVLVTEVAKLGQGDYIVSAKILNVETARLEKAENVQSDFSLLQINCKNLAKKLFPSKSKKNSSTELKTNEGIYKGEFKHVPDGNGSLVYGNESSAISYSGTWKNGRKEGRGTMIWKNGDRYEGNWVNDQRSGEGKYYWGDGGTYKGEWLNGEMNGYGEKRYANGNIYKGNWYNGNKSGKGTMYFQNGRYEGNWENDQRTGEGKYYWTNGDYVVANWKNGKREGAATYYHKNGDFESGSYVNDKQEGPWRYYKAGSWGYDRTYIYKAGEIVDNQYDPYNKLGK